MAFNIGGFAGGAAQGLNTTLRAYQTFEDINDTREKRDERKREVARKEALFGDVKNLYGDFDKRRQGNEFDPVKDVEDLASNLTLTRAKHGYATPEELTQLGDRYKKAQTEGITDAMQLLAAGKDAEAMEVFQKRGQFRIDDPAAVKITRQNRMVGGMPVPDVTIEGTSGGKPFKLSRWDMLMQTMPPDKVAGMAKNVAGADYLQRRNPTKEKPVKYPPRTSVLDVKDMIASDPKLSELSDEDQEKLAFNIAAKAQQILTSNPGTDASDAIAAALDDEMQNITPGEQRSFLGIDRLARDRAPTYVDRRVRRPASPAPAAAPPAPAATRTPAAPPTTRTPIQIGSDAEYARLPSGTLFRAPDGTLRRKP